jgi:hypothetical protein
MGAESTSIRRDFTGLVLRFNAADRRVQDSWNKQPMFVSDIQSVYGPNGKIPSLVGLYITNHHLKQIPRSFIYAVPAKRGFKRIISAVNRKLCELSESMGSQLSNGFDPRIVKGTLEIVDPVSNDQSNVPNGFPSLNVMFNDFVTDLRIDLNSGSIALFQQFDPIIQSSNMLLSPPDF